jgi:general secretion pathway protein E
MPQRRQPPDGAGRASYLINATLLGVLAQRLVRTLCSSCKVRDEDAKPEDLAESVRPWKLTAVTSPTSPWVARTAA